MHQIISVDLGYYFKGTATRFSTLLELLQIFSKIRGDIGGKGKKSSVRKV
jgi:hypothetical protein